jgi:hypothetical protein
VRAEAWGNELQRAYAFVDDATGAVLQSGSSKRFIPRAAHRGAPIACVVRASNAGGTSTAHTGTTAAVQPDLVPPNAVLRSVRCRDRRRTVWLRAADRNAEGALRVRVPRRGRRFEVEHLKRTSYRARSCRLPRGSATIRVRVRDAAGNRRREISRRVWCAEAVNEATRGRAA